MADTVQITVSPITESVRVAISESGSPGATGADGTPGVGVPTGGTTGQVLSKSSAVDYATTWVDQASGNPFNQNLNTTDSATFDDLTLTGDLSCGKIQSAPSATTYFQLLGNEFRFYAAGSSRLTLDATGNVGVNTISPDSSLDVNGDLMVSGQNDLHVYSDLDSPTSNFERLSLSVDALGDATIATSSGGTGDDGDLVLAPASKNTRVDGSLDLSGSSSNSIKLYGSAEIKGGSIRLRSGTANYLWLDSWATTSFRIWSDARGLSINNTTAGTYPVNISPAGEFRVYSDLDDPSGTFERVSMSVDANGDATIATESGGMGDDGDLILAPASGVIDVNGDARFRARIIRSKSVYVGTDTTDDVALHVCDSATAFTLTVTDGADDGEEIKIVNRGAGTVTLSGKINTTTAVASLASGETIVLNWDATDDEWQ